MGLIVSTPVQVAMEYEAFLVKEGLTLRGLQQTYDDGIGDVDTDYETLGLADLVSLSICAYENASPLEAPGKVQLPVFWRAEDSLVPAMCHPCSMGYPVIHFYEVSVDLRVMEP